MEILLLAASLRKESCNKKLIQLTHTLLQAQSIETHLLDFSEYIVPLYDGDVEENQGIPDKAKQFIEVLRQADALILSTPEYNFSVPGTLKNLIDWVSRAHPMPWKQVPILLMSASPAVTGGCRALLSATVPLEACGAYVCSNSFFLSKAYEAFKEDGALKDADTQRYLQNILNGFMQFVQAVNFRK